MMKFVKKIEPENPCYGEIESGTLFRFPEQEDIYIKTSDADRAIHLMTGEFDDFSEDDIVIVVDGTLLWKDR